MKIRFTIVLTAAGAVLLSVVAAPVAAETFTFTATNGVWNLDTNWAGTPGLTPGASDTAVIPSGKTCRVDDANQAALVITVESGGTLEIVDRLLAIGANSTVDGLMDFTTGAAELRILSSLTLGGSGTVSATLADDVGVKITNSSDTYTITIGTDLTLNGDFAIVTNISNLGLIVVDGVDGGDHLGVTTPLGAATTKIGGEGTWRVSDGTIMLRDIEFLEDGVGTWEITDTGELELHEICGGCANFWGIIDLSGGTLTVDTDLCTSSFLSFSLTGGTIDVGFGASVSLNGTCP